MRRINLAKSARAAPKPSTKRRIARHKDPKQVLDEVIAAVGGYEVDESAVDDLRSGRR